MRLHFPLGLFLAALLPQHSFGQDRAGVPDSLLPASATDAQRVSTTIVNEIGIWELLRCTRIAGGVDCEFRLTPRVDCFRCTLVLGPYDNAGIALTFEGEEMASISGTLGRQSSKRFVANRLTADVPIKGSMRFGVDSPQLDRIALVRLAGTVRFQRSETSREFHVHFKNVPVTVLQPDSGDAPMADATDKSVWR